MNINIGNLLKYFATLSVSFHDINSLFGFWITFWINTYKLRRIFMGIYIKRYNL
jgi:hypothetical protein